MERPRRELEALVNTQKEQLMRYEKRLKDVVTAYKGLLKEKEALETSLAAISASKDIQRRESVVASRRPSDASDAASPGSADETLSASSNPTVAATPPKDNSDEAGHLQTQIVTLMNSLATLSAEKSRMEASFQADKKSLRAQLAQKDHTVTELLDKIRQCEERAKADVNDVRAKWMLERQEREKETNNQMLMIRELQKLYGDERHLKENIEMQLNNFKTQFAGNDNDNVRLRELQQQLKEAKAHLRNAEERKLAGDAEPDSASVLKHVQMEMQQLKEQHAVAIKSEQRRAVLAEEQSRKQAALHEDRVANLEARLAELSCTVGNYDRLRQQDQVAIQSLKEKCHALESNTDAAFAGARDPFSRLPPPRLSNTADLAAIIDEIVRLKQLLVCENARSMNPIDVSKIFTMGTDHTLCSEEIGGLQQQCEAAHLEVAQLQAKLQVQRTHISTLQEKVIVLNRNIDDQEQELKHQAERLNHAVKEERTKWRDNLADVENDCRAKVNNLEQQLQKQRQRSLQLLDEKEEEIKTLQTSFEIFHNATNNVSIGNASGSNIPSGDRLYAGSDLNTTSSDAESGEGEGATSSTFQPAGGRNSGAGARLKSKRLSLGGDCHMLHYANEIARKDIEIAGLRKSKYAAETALRRAIHDKVAAQEELSDKIANLEEQVDRLERCKTREGANLEYLKNVIISFILTKDADGKRHMLNAISAVLQFTPAEIHTIHAAAFHSSKKANVAKAATREPSH